MKLSGHVSIWDSHNLEVCSQGRSTQKISTRQAVQAQIWVFLHWQMTSLKAGLNDKSFAEAEERQSTDLDAFTKCASLSWISPHTHILTHTNTIQFPHVHTKLMVIQKQGKCSVVQPGISYVKWTAGLLFLLSVPDAQWQLKGIVLYFEAYIKGSLITGMISVSSATRNPDLELM